MSRGQAYWWLSRQLGLPKSKTHMKQFDEAMCDQVVKVCSIYFFKLNKS